MRYATRTLKLANGKIKQITRQLAEGDPPAPDETVTDSAPAEMTEPAEVPSLDEAQFSALQGPVSELLTAAYGVQLPDGTTAENFIANLSNVISVAKQMAPSVSEETPVDALDAMPVEDMTTAEMSLAVKAYRKDRAKTRQLALAQAEVNYTAKLDTLVRTAKVLAKGRQPLLDAGRASGWNLSILDGFEHVNPELNVTSKTRRLSADAGESKSLTNREIREAALKATGLLRTTKQGA